MEKHDPLKQITNIKTGGLDVNSDISKVLKSVEDLRDLIRRSYEYQGELTLEIFNEIPNGAIFNAGYTLDSPEGLNITGSGKPLKWLAKKGYGNDWAIYTHWTTSSWEFVETNGDKVGQKENILKLVPCTEEIYNKYRR